MSESAVHLSEYYRSLTEEELLDLAQQRQELEEAASTALDAELTARGLGQDALDQFEARVQPKLESEAEDANDELTSPQELPDDWFTDEGELPSASPTSSRPKGVTVGAFIFWLSGFVSTGLGGFSVIAAAKAGGTTLLLEGLLEITLGVASFIAGFGLWRLQPWGRKLAIALCWVGITLSALNIAAAAFLRLRGDAVDSAEALIYWANLFWQVLWMLYLSRNSTRQAFREGNADECT